MSDITSELERLVQLRDSGGLTLEEFESQKARVLATRESVTTDPAPFGVDPVADEIVRATQPKKMLAMKRLREQTGIDVHEAKSRIDASYLRLGFVDRIRR
jgi:ribosomal protein L7/L12